jgi:hypothetical protein
MVHSPLCHGAVYWLPTFRSNLRPPSAGVGFFQTLVVCTRVRGVINQQTAFEELIHSVCGVSSCLFVISII